MFQPCNVAVPSAELLAAYTPVLSDPHRITFLGVDGMDVYNISVPFTCQGKTYIAGRVEPRNSELSVVRIFEQVDADTYQAILPEKTFKLLQDPFVTFIGDELVLGGVQVITDPLNDKRIVSWHTCFYKGETPADLKLFAVGPAHMKDIRLCGLADGRVAVFSRPQGLKGGKGRIGFTIIDCLEDLCDDRILEAVIDPSFFIPEEWGGCNQVHLLKNGLLGVIGHIAHRGEDRSLHYNAMSFVLDPATGAHTKLHILGTRANVTNDPNSKRPDLMDVLFTGGVIRNGDGTAAMYTGVSDCQAWYVTIPDPFTAYED